MVTKAIVQSINRASNRCVVRMPLFENASGDILATTEAIISITPGFYNNLFVGDIVIVAFEENAIEKPIIIGKLFKGASNEGNTAGGMGILDTLKVNSSAALPASTLFTFPENVRAEYENIKTPKKIADYIKWLESFFKGLINQIDNNFSCFKNWTQWQLKPENVEIDDGDIDSADYREIASNYKKEGSVCKICDNKCIKNKIRQYSKLDIDKTFTN